MNVGKEGELWSKNRGEMKEFKGLTIKILVREGEVYRE